MDMSRDYARGVLTASGNLKHMATDQVAVFDALGIRQTAFHSLREGGDVLTPYLQTVGRVLQNPRLDSLTF